LIHSSVSLGNLLCGSMVQTKLNTYRGKFSPKKSYSEIYQYRYYVYFFETFTT
jgi:hypothetical protein